MISFIKRILSFSGIYKGRIELAFVFSFLKAMLSKAPIMLGFIAIINFYRGTADSMTCLWLGIGMIGCLALQIVFQNIADRLQSAAGFMIMADTRVKLGAHLRKMPMGYFTEGNIGKISSILSSDMVFIEENSMTVLGDLMGYVFGQFVMILFLFFFNVWIALGATLLLAIIITIATMMRKQAMKHADVRQAQNENLTESVLDFVEGIGIAKTYNLLGQKSKELSGNFERTCTTSIAFEKNQAPWMIVLNILYALGAASIILLSMTMENHGLLEVTMVIGMMLFVFDVFGPIKALYNEGTRLIVMNSCLDRIEEVLNEKELPDNGKDSIPESSDGTELELSNVSFSYDQKEVLHDISFSLERNKMLALVGASGSGKTTIANLLARFWDVSKGKVLVRGKDVRDVSLSDLMNNISMVFQRVYLFKDTIYNNISMGRPDATKEEVIDAAKKARCYDFIMALPNGFDTMIGEGGETLSGGEKQRISIARCILKDAPIIILDEATASVDADNEVYIQDAITELCKGKTVVVIAHRLNTIKNADTILVISDGKIAERGNHEALMNEGGIYHKFVTMRSASQGWNRRTN